MNNHDLIHHGNSDENLPFGMSGVTGLLDRLRDGSEDTWEDDKSDMVARYLLDLRDRYWMSEDETSFCRSFLSLN